MKNYMNEFGIGFDVMFVLFWVAYILAAMGF